MNVKKARRNNLSRSFFIGVISVTSVIGMCSVGFASWSFANTVVGDTVKVEADNISITTVDAALGTFGVSISDTSASVEHYTYTVMGEEYVLDDEGSLTYTEDEDTSESIPVTTETWVTNDVYGDLKIHSKLAVDLTSTTSNNETINTIEYDDTTYTYLKIDVALQGTFLNITGNNCTLSLNTFPQYTMDPDSRQSSYLPVTYSYYFPVKSTTSMSIYSLALVDNITTGGTIPFDLDFTFDLSENPYGNGNTNRVNTIAMTFSIISLADYNSDWSK